jgi:hypothetical protein
MELQDFNARVSTKRASSVGPFEGKYLYIYTDQVYPGQLAGFWSSKDSQSSPTPDDGTSFEFGRSEFYWMAYGAYNGIAILLTLDLTTVVVCPTANVAEAIYSPTTKSLFMVPLMPWATSLPEVKPSDRRDGSED